MTLLNYGHPLTPEQLAAVEAACGQPVSRLLDLKGQYDQNRSFADQAVELADAAGLSPEDWQQEPLLLSPPTLHVMAVTLLAELHGRCGYFPAVVRLRPVPGAVPPRFEFAEILDLNGIREAARGRR